MGSHQLQWKLCDVHLAALTDPDDCASPRIASTRCMTLCHARTSIRTSRSALSGLLLLASALRRVS